MRIAINGAGIGGTTLAYWLRQAGHDVLLVEESPQLRRDGFIVDFWGIGYDVAEKMGLRDRIGELDCRVNESRLVDRNSRKRAGYSLDIFRRVTDGRFTTLRRSDLAAAIYRALDDDVETIFGDSVRWIEDTGTCVRVGFDHAAARDVDLVVGTDGLHSRVRELAFAPEAIADVPLGYYFAAFEIEGYRPRNEGVFITHGAPGRQISRLSMPNDKTLFLLIFRDEYLTDNSPSSGQECKRVLADIYADVGWECPQILAAMDGASELYFDRVSQIRMAQWTNGRVALVGDAAACVSLFAGEGAGLAMAAAYVLAGELHHCKGDHPSAFARYQESMMPFLRRKQASAVKLAPLICPKGGFGLAYRRLLTQSLRIPFVSDVYVGRFLRDDFKLPEYAP